MTPEDVVVAERELKEAEAVGAAGSGFLRIRMTREPGDHGDVRVHRVADRHALRLERLVVILDPMAGLGRVDERERECAHPELRGEMNGFAIRARDPQRRMRLLHRLRDDVAYRHREILALEAGVRVHDHHVGDLLDRLAPHRAALGRGHAEAFELRARCGFAGAPVDAAVGDEIEGRDPLGDTRRMVVAGRHQDDAVTEADTFRALRGGGEEDFRRRRVRVLLEEVMLDFPRVIDAEPVGELDLRQRVLKQALLAVRLPGARQLVFVEDPEAHARMLAEWNVPPNDVGRPSAVC